MSADAKAWLDGTDNGWVGWRGIHDGHCPDGSDGSTAHTQMGTSLHDLLDEFEHCMGKRLRWEVRTYPDGTIGLAGYQS